MCKSYKTLTFTSLLYWSHSESFCSKFEGHITSAQRHAQNTFTGCFKTFFYIRWCLQCATASLTKQSNFDPLTVPSVKVGFRVDEVKTDCSLTCLTPPTSSRVENMLIKSGCTTCCTQWTEAVRPRSSAQTTWVSLKKQTYKDTNEHIRTRKHKHSTACIDPK